MNKLDYQYLRLQDNKAFLGKTNLNSSYGSLFGMIILLLCIFIAYNNDLIITLFLCVALIAIILKSNTYLVIISNNKIYLKNIYGRKHIFNKSDFKSIKETFMQYIEPHSFKILLDNREFTFVAPMNKFTFFDTNNSKEKCSILTKELLSVLTDHQEPAK